MRRLEGASCGLNQRLLGEKFQASNGTASLDLLICRQCLINAL
jgi:hypothetical protein